MAAVSKLQTSSLEPWISWCLYGSDDSDELFSSPPADVSQQTLNRPSRKPVVGPGMYGNPQLHATTGGAAQLVLVFPQSLTLPSCLRLLPSTRQRGSDGITANQPLNSDIGGSANEFGPHEAL